MDAARSISVLIVSKSRILAQSMREALDRGACVALDPCFAIESAAARIREQQPNAVLFDARLSHGPRYCRSLLWMFPAIRGVVFDVADAADEISEWVEAGIAGYIPQAAATADVAPLLMAIMSGVQICAAPVTAAVLRSACGFRREPPSDACWAPPLSVRELQVMAHVAAGAGDDAICRRLNVDRSGLQVLIRSLLHKLSLQRRPHLLLWAIFVAQGAKSAQDVAQRINAMDRDGCADSAGDHSQEMFLHSGEALLTERELEIMRWTARGKTAFEISVILKLTERTVHFHIGRVLTKLGAINKTEAAVRCATLGLIGS